MRSKREHEEKSRIQEVKAELNMRQRVAAGATSQ
jgi:hypothetical protein